MYKRRAKEGQKKGKGRTLEFGWRSSRWWPLKVPIGFVGRQTNAFGEAV
jgi:hypothetical protein